MNTNEIIPCDRCGKLITVDNDNINYYDMSKGYWSKFRRWEENVICKDCMTGFLIVLNSGTGSNAKFYEEKRS